MKNLAKKGVWQMNDPVNYPSHYTTGKIEVIDFIKDKELGFCLGNAVKYIARAGKKDPTKTVEDLEKAVWYLNHEITHLGEKPQPNVIYDVLTQIADLIEDLSGDECDVISYHDDQIIKALNRMALTLKNEKEISNENS
jgi:hypothetical protein